MVSISGSTTQQQIRDFERQMLESAENTEPTRKVAEEAMATLANRLEQELRSQLARRAGQASARGGAEPR